MKIEPALDTRNWHAMFRLRTAPLASHVRNLDFVHEALSAIDQDRPKLPPEIDRLFELHAYLYVLELLLNRLPDQTSSARAFIGFHTYEAIAEVEKVIEALLKEKPAASDEPFYWLIINETLAYLREQMLTETGNKLYFADPYFLLWQQWIAPFVSDDRPYQDELERLNAAPAKLGKALSHYSWRTAQIWMTFLLRRDGEVFAALEEINSKTELRQQDIFPLFDMMENAGDWQRLADWVIKLTPIMEKQRMHFLESFYRYWDDILEHLPSLEAQMWEPIIRSLPYTESLYEEKLLYYGKWQQWIDYQISTGTEPLSYRVSVFAPIEKHAPELLLPFYHQAAERYVLLKNRDGYKSAVKLLKRLAKLYKKMKNEERWEAFIDAFSSRHSRLRALQEELRKGKLIE